MRAAKLRILKTPVNFTGVFFVPIGPMRTAFFLRRCQRPKSIPISVTL